MENFENNFSSAQTPETVSPEPRFSSKQKTAAWCALVAGFFAARLLLWNFFPLGSLIFSLAVYIATSLFIFTEGRTVKVKDVVIPTAATVLSFGHIVTSDRVLQNLISLALCIMYVYWVWSALADSKEGFPGKLAFFELIKAVFVVALPSFGTIWPALFSKRRAGSKNTVGWILLGIAVALVPTAAIVGLLSYDSDFIKLMGKLTNWNIFGNLGENIFALIFGIPVAMFLFGLLYASQNGLRKDVLGEETTLRVISAVRFAPAPLAAAAMTPALVIYVIFFISQKNNYIYALTGLKPDGINYADFARNGFFELCAVAAINAVIILAVNLFMKRAKEKAPLLRVYSAIYSVFTLVLIATALSKMILYIREYGLTRMRLLTSCFMVLLAFCFLAVLLAQFIRRLRLVGIIASAALLVLAAVTLTDTDRLIGEYNVSAYLSGAHKEIDTDHFYELGRGAVPAAVRLYLSDRTDPQKKTETEYFLKNTAEEFKTEAEDTGFFEELFTFSFPKSKARAALEKAGFSTEPDPTPETYDSRFDA